MIRLPTFVVPNSSPKISATRSNSAMAARPQFNPPTTTSKPVRIANARMGEPILSCVGTAAPLADHSTSHHHSPRCEQHQLTVEKDTPGSNTSLNALHVRCTATAF